MIASTSKTPLGFHIPSSSSPTYYIYKSQPLSTAIYKKKSDTQISHFQEISVLSLKTRNFFQLIKVTKKGEMGREIVNVHVEREEKDDDQVKSKAYSARELPLLALNHVSFVCKSVKKSVQFYEQVLGFVLIKRPSSFDFEGAWLFNHGIGIHLLEMETAPAKKGNINPKDNHISFQCTNMDLIVRQLEEMEIEYVKGVVREGGILVDQLFFHDPDGYMLEICNCQNIPILPIASSCPLNSKIMPTPNAQGSVLCRDEL